MFEEVQALARRENRTMSELVREALRHYQREQVFARARAHMEAVADQVGVQTEEDVVRVIRELRQEDTLARKVLVQTQGEGL